MSYEISDSVTVQASPEQVFDLVSDVTRTGEWSPQCHRCEWLSDERGVGAQFTGHNKVPGRDWSTTSTVVAAERGVEFTWRVARSEVVWGYRMAPAEQGTELTEFTVLDAAGEQFFAGAYGDDAAAQIEARREAAVAGIRVTLERIRAIADGGLVREDA